MHSSLLKLLGMQDGVRHHMEKQGLTRRTGLGETWPLKICWVESRLGRQLSQIPWEVWRVLGTDSD